MSTDLPAKTHASRARFRGMITTVLMVMLAVMIVRDILVRRWGSAAPPSSDMTHRSP